MSCKICGRGNCTSSFHSIEAQQEHEADFGEYEDKIDELKDEVTGLNNQIEKCQEIMTHEQWEEFDKWLGAN